MTKILSCLIVGLILISHCRDALVAPQMTQNYTSLVCENENGTDRRMHGCDNTYDVGFRDLIPAYFSISTIKKYFFGNHQECVLHHSTRSESLDLIAVDLSTVQKEIVATVATQSVYSNETTWLYPENSGISQIAITSNGLRLDTFYTDWNFDLMQQTTTRCAGVSSITRKIGKRITTPVVDWVTSNVYYVSDSQIIICDQNFVFCATLPSANNTTVTETLFLAISPERRLLFSVVKQKSSADYQLLAHSLDNVLKPPSLIRKGLINPKWITVDPAQERLYWYDGFEQNTPIFYSLDFKGQNLEEIPLRSDSMIDDSPFAVFNNSVFWLNVDQDRKIIQCLVHDCSNSMHIFEPISEMRPDRRDKIELGYPIIDYRPSNSINYTDLCNESSCSHLCLPESETEYRCYCQHNMKKPISLLDKKNGFCEDYTLLAAYKNILYVVGLPDNDFAAPKIREHKINISSIAAVTYDSINGNVILTEAGQQKIYLWSSLTKELKLILDGGPGTINSLAFDHYANNLYWIDPGVRVIKAMNLRTCTKVNILKGNSSYTPIQFVLIPSKGYMAVLFLRKNLSITIQCVSMDGISRQVVHDVDDKINYNAEDFSLYYWKENQIIGLLDRRANRSITYFLAEKSLGLRRLWRKEAMGKVESLAFLKNSIVWSEEDLVIQKAQISLEDLHLGSVSRAARISLGVHPSSTDLDTGKNSVFRFFGIERQNGIPAHAAKCLRNNGGCLELEMCLVSKSRYYSQVSCLRPEDEELMSNISSGEMKQLQSTYYSEIDNMTSASSEESTENEINTNTTLAETNLGSIVSYQKDSKKPVEYQSTTNLISAADIYCFLLLVTFLILASFIGYLSLHFISDVKKRIDRFSQKEERPSVLYWNAGSQFSLNYPPSDDE